MLFRSNSAIQADYASAQGHAGLAQVREQSGDTGEARTEALASIKIAPNANAYLVLARLDLQQNDLHAAALDVQNALHVEPNNPAVMGMRQALLNRGQSVP